MLAKWMLTSVVVLGLGAPMWADDPDDGPGRGVARISVINGDVSVKRGDSGDYVAAALNAPLVVEDRVFTGSGARTELQFDWANMLRVSSNAEVRLAELEYRRYLVQVARGTITWRVLRDQEAYVEISTPSVSVRPVKRGTYRVTVLEDGSSEITVRSGEAEIFTPRGSERLKSGRTMMARGTASDPEFRFVSEIHGDEWDRWNEYRDRDLERSRSYSYVSRDVYGAEDLDSHGHWVYVPPYGWVWSPYVASGWAPYRYGRWSWIDWYGWSWVSYDPWGWAPYHYGRWFYDGPRGWCWWPGGLGGRHYWSPGFVAFFGYGRVGVGLGWGNVGWIPLAPYEPYHRWYGSRWYGGYRNRTYIDNSVTVVNNVNITNVYRNSRVNNAVTVVDQEGFSRGRVGNVVRVTDADLRGATVARGPLPVTPARESLRLADRDTNLRPAEGRTSERFFSRTQPARVERATFEEQRSGIEHITRRTFGDQAVGGGAAAEGVRRGEARPAGEAGRPAEPSRGDRGASGSVRTAETPQQRTDEQRGWRRAEETPRGGTGGTVERQNRNAGGEGGWRNFGAARVGEAPEANRTDRSGRFGQPATPRVESRPAESRGSSPDNSGWVRFGDRGNRPEASGSSGSVERRPANDSWRREISPRNEQPRSEQPRNETPRMESAPRTERNSMPDRGVRESAPRMERRSEPAPSRGESIRISPPIVRERSGDGGGGGRSAPSVDRGSSRGSDGGGRSAPSVDRGSSRGSDGGSTRGGGETRGGRGR